MTQFTKFTNLPIYTDPERTAITNTLIESIPFNKDVYSEDGSLTSLRNETITMLYTSQVLADSRELFIYEEENHGWSITSYDPSTRIQITEYSSGRWQRCVLETINGLEQFMMVEEYVPEIGLKKYIATDNENRNGLYFNDLKKQYVFNVTSFTSEKMRVIGKHFENVDVEEDYESAYFCGTKEGIANGIDQLVSYLIQAKHRILNDQSV